MSLRNKLLIALLSIAVTPMIVVGGWVYIYAQKAIETAKSAELVSTANLKVQKIEDFFSEREKDIVLVQNNLIIKKNISALIRQPDNPSEALFKKANNEIDNVLKIKNKIFQYKINILITNPKGEIIYSLNHAEDLSTTQKILKANYDQFQQNTLKEIYFSDVFAAGKKNISMLMMVPAYDLDHTPRGAIVFDVDMTTLFDFMRDTKGLGETGETVIFRNTQNGLVVLSSLRHDMPVIQNNKETTVDNGLFSFQSTLSGKDDAGFAVDYRGKKVLAVRRSIPRLAWELAAKIDENEALESVSRLKRIVLLVGLISIAASIIIALMFAHSLTRPIETLKKGVELIGKGGNLNFDIVETHRKDEIGILAEAFGKMAKNLKIITASRDELDREVSDRKKAEAQINHLNQVLQTIRMVNKHITAAKDAEGIIKGVCKIIADYRGYHNAWIALLDKNGTVTSCSESGIGSGIMEMEALLKQGDIPACSLQGIACTEVLSIEDPEIRCEACTLMEQCAGKCVFTAKLEYEGELYGLLTASIPKNIAMHTEEQTLFLELAKEIAYSLNKLEIASEREQSELARKRSEKQFQDLVEHSPTGISIIRDGRIVYQNPEQEKLLGPLPRPNLFSDFEKIHPDDLGRVKQFHDRLVAKELDSATIEYRYYTDKLKGYTPQLKWVHVNAGWIEFQGKASILINILDVSTTKELEKIIRTQDKMSSLGRVAAGIAHEIRNPLSGINIYLDTLRKTIGKPDSLEKQEKIIDRSKDASKKIETIIKRVMDFSKPGEPMFVLSNINHPIEEAIHLSSVTLRKTNIRLMKRLDDHLPGCLIDAHMIEQVILNMITNAIEAMKDIETEKTIKIDSFAEEDHVCVTVSDSGHGVPEHIKNNIFEPFYSTKQSGSGIGLSICHRIIADHGGTLTVSANDMGGAVFKIQIPIAHPSLI